MWITWKDKDDDLIWPIPLEKKIDIFYQQALGWQLHVADLVANGGLPLDGGTTLLAIRHSGFAVLQICLSYFETIGKYQAPKGSHKKDNEYFKAGVQAVFPSIRNVPSEVRKQLLDVLWKDARCGLYHNSRTRHRVGLGQPPNGEAMAYDSEAQILAISPEHLPQDLKAHLERYRTDLLNPVNGEARQNFEYQFDKDFGVTRKSQSTVP